MEYLSRMHAGGPGDGEGLLYEDTLPLSWQEIGPTAPDRALSVQQANERLLRHLAAIEEHRIEPADEGHPQIMQDLARLDLKVNLLLDMVGQLLSRQMVLPDPAPIKLGADRLQWTSRQSPPRPGDRLMVELYLNPRYPNPLTLLGTVEKVSQEGRGHVIEMVYGDVGEVVKDGLEKMIFRHHRRHIAQSRRPSKKHDF
jgi:hypothetical protein